MLQQQECLALPTCACERLSRSTKPKPFGNVEDKWGLLVILFVRQNEDRKIAPRDLHPLLDLPQQVAFRLIRGLELGRLIMVGIRLHDAFAAELALTGECSTLVTRCSRTGNERLTLSIREMLAIGALSRLGAPMKIRHVDA